MRRLSIPMVVIVFLAGCGGTESISDDSFGSPTTIESLGESENIESDQTPTTGPTGGEPAISDFIPGAVAWNGPEPQQQMRELERAVQELVAACMAEEGFEYVAYVANPDPGGFAGPDSDEALVEEYGFGVATVALKHLYYDGEAMEAAAEAERAKDPNTAIVAAMGDTEREAYDVALRGEGPGALLVDAAEVPEDATDWPSKSPGCYGIASDEVYGFAIRAEFDNQFGPMLEDAYAGIESDLRIAKAEADWSLCMAEHGYDFDSLSDIRLFLFRRLEEIGAVAHLEVFQDGGGFSVSRADVEPGGPVEAAIREIAAEEIAMAERSLACSSDREVRQEVRREAEQRFIEEHLAELEQFRRDHS